MLSSLNELVARTGDSNMVLPHFVRNVLPSGLAGLVFAGVFAATMSVFSSGLNSLSTATCMDFIQRLRRIRSHSEDLTLAGARWITLVWGLFVTLAAIGVYFAHIGSALADRRRHHRFLQRTVVGHVPAGHFHHAGEFAGRHPRHGLRLRIGPALVAPRVVHLVRRDGLRADLDVRLCHQLPHAAASEGRRIPDDHLGAAHVRVM